MANVMSNLRESFSDKKEGPVARRIEQETAKIPSDMFLWGAVAAGVGSMVLQGMRKGEMSNFVGQWVPTLLILGLYNKLVKVMGSDSESSHSAAA